MSAHPVDRLAGAIYMFKGKRLRLFPEGWGEDLSHFDRSPGGEPETIDVIWSPPAASGRTRLGHFESPLGELLADGLRRVPFEMTEPPQGADRLVVLLPSWNDHGFTTRRKLAAELARLGIASVAFDIPLYGQRRRTPEPEQAIRTVADFGLMGVRRNRGGALTAGTLQVEIHRRGGGLLDGRQPRRAGVQRAIPGGNRAAGSLPLSWSRLPRRHTARRNRLGRPRRAEAGGAVA